MLINVTVCPVFNWSSVGTQVTSDGFNKAKDALNKVVLFWLQIPVENEKSIWDGFRPAYHCKYQK